MNDHELSLVGFLSLWRIFYTNILVGPIGLRTVVSTLTSLEIFNLTWKYWLADAFSVLSLKTDRFFIRPEAVFNISLKSLTSTKVWHIYSVYNFIILKSQDYGFVVLSLPIEQPASYIKTSCDQ